jgi:large subunit ribosomal protein L25
MTTTLSVTKRDQKIKLNILRANGKVPAVVYGPKLSPQAIEIEDKNLAKIIKEAGESTLITLAGLETPIDVLVKGVSFDPVKQFLTHVDFYAVEAGKEMTTNVHLDFVGESPAEKDGHGVITKILHEVEITCKPNALPNHLDVDLCVLQTVGNKILVSDIVVPKGVTVLTEADSVVAVLSELTTEEVSDTVDMNAVEVESRGKEKTDV